MALKLVIETVLWIIAIVLVSLTLNQEAKADITLQTGIDYWKVPNEQVRYLPNYNTQEPWRKTEQFMIGSGSYQTGQFKFTLAGKITSLNGSRIDRADIDYNLGSWGLRAGVLPYRVSWCRTYDNSSPWISETDAFCRSPILNEISNGAAGVQVYQSNLWGGYLVDALAGVYRPMLDNQDKSLGPYKKVGETVKHNKYGGSINIMHLESGNQIRAAWLHTDLNQNDDRDGIAHPYQRQLSYETYYLAGEMEAIKNVTLRLSGAAYIGSQNNSYYPYKWNGTSVTLEGIWQVNERNTLAVGASRYTNDTNYENVPNKTQTLVVPNISIAWRHNFEDGYFGIIQATKSKDDYTTVRDENTFREGSAVGVRLGKVF